MAKVILGMTTSLDGLVADQDGRAGRLYPDLAALQGTAYMNGVIEETGAGEALDLPGFDLLLQMTRGPLRNHDRPGKRRGP